MDNNEVVLFDDKSKCCGCRACENICPKSAISMYEDEYGFTYPKINRDLCVKCGACKKVCAYQNLPEMNKPINTYAVADKNDEQIRKSASGGAFVVIARQFIENGGIVYGSSMEYENGKLYPRHIRVSSIDELVKLQGSKYVQSDMGAIYKAVKKDLSDGNCVLFSGTPCQIAAVKSFVGNKAEDLYTIEIICHGVPGRKMFQDFIDCYSEKLGGEIKEFYFRDKSKGQGMITRSVWNDKNGKRHETVKIGGLLSFVYFFSKSYIYRINCYSCPYATGERCSDLTIGDFWGFHEEYPDVSEKTGFSNGRGISCLLVNNKKGQELVSESTNEFAILDSTFEKISKHNDQLHSPSKYSELRECILDIYDKEGYTGVDEYYKKHCAKSRMKHRISGMIPKDFKRKIKKVIGKVRG